MKKALKITGLVTGTLLAALIIATVTVYLITEAHWNKNWDVVSDPIEISNDEALLAQGKHVYTIRGCVECHGENLGGMVFLEDPVMGRIVPTNLTTGEGGIGSTYSDEDLARSIRRGVKPDGKSVFFMPSHEYNLINREDMTALISYIRSAPAVNNVLPENKLAIPMRFIYLMSGGDVHLFPAQLINQEIAIPETAPQTVLEQGEYLAATCTGCHGAGFSGGLIPGMPPDWPPASNLTPEGNIGDWSPAEFITTMRSGVTPEGVNLAPEYMPWRVLGAMTDEELTALYTYLQSITPQATGNR